MGDFLTAVSTVSLKSKQNTDKLIVEEVVPERPKSRTVRKSPASADEALNILRSSPDEDALHDLLSFFKQPSQQSAGFDIKVPTPSSAKVVNELINTTLPDFWGTHDQTNVLILDCLRSVAGIGAILAKLRISISKCQAARKGIQGLELTQPLSDLLTILSQLLCSDDLAENVYDDIDRLVESQARRALLWKEFLTLVGTGKIIASAAEAEDTVKSAGGRLEPSWLSNGSKYSAWIGRNVGTILHKSTSDTSTYKAAAQLCGKALGIGYPGRKTLSHNDNHVLSVLQSESLKKSIHVSHSPHQMQAPSCNQCSKTYKCTSKGNSWTRLSRSCQNSAHLSYHLRTLTIP